MTKDPNKPLSSDADDAEVQKQIRLGLEIMKKHRETFAALAKGPAGGAGKQPEPQDDKEKKE